MQDRKNIFLDKKCTFLLKQTQFVHGGDKMKFIYEKERHGKLLCYINDDLDVPAHIHDNIELIYIIRGTAKAFYDGKEYALSKGDAFIAFPQRVHYFYESHDIDAVISIIPIEYLPEFRNLFTEKNILTPHLTDVPSLAGTLLKEAATVQTAYDKAFRRGAILSAFSLLAEKAEFIDKKASDVSTLQKILDYCENNYKENISLEDVSKALFISKSYISHIFSEKIQMGFRDYLNSLRVSHSLNHLKDGKLSVSEIAVECGFESIRSFNRAFKKIYTTTPTEYKRSSDKLM